jgi:hypothetical protein
MKHAFLINFLRFFGILTVLFGVLGMGSGLYVYFQVKPKMENLPVIIEDAYSSINTKTEDVIVILNEGGDLLNDIADKGNFSIIWWSPFADFEEDLRILAESLHNSTKELDADISNLEKLKDDLLKQSNQLESVLMVLVVYFSLLHFIFIVTGLSLFYIGGFVKQNTLFLEKIIEESKKEKIGDEPESKGQDETEEDPYEILKIRHQIGEISQEEYDELYSKLIKEKNLGTEED